MKDLFSTESMNRKAWERSSPELIEARLHGKHSRIVVWFDGKLLLQPSGSIYFSWLELAGFFSHCRDPVYLGHYQGGEFFSCELLQWHESLEGLDTLNLRSACHRVDAFDRKLLFHAQGMINWHRDHAYCSFCGSAMQAIQSGHARRCCNPDCAKTQYPKIDPAVIFSVINNTGSESKILLARKKQWDENRYSVLAGFVEPGETLEDSVKREAYEEAGIRVEQVEYIAAQPWPFPDALMLGFCCQTRQQKIELIDQELELACWFSADEIESLMQQDAFKMPFEFSIAWHLINRWFVQQKGYDIARA